MMEGSKPTPTEQASKACTLLMAVVVAPYLLLYFYCCFISLLRGTHYITTFFVCNFVAVFAVAVQITLLTKCEHLFMDQFSSSLTGLSSLGLYIHQTESQSGCLYYVSHLTVSHLTEMSPQQILYIFQNPFPYVVLESKSDMSLLIYSLTCPPCWYYLS